MAGQRDYYQVLGVPHDADAKAIKNAFRRLARRCCPRQRQLYELLRADHATGPGGEDTLKAER